MRYVMPKIAFLSALAILLGVALVVSAQTLQTLQTPLGLSRTQPEVNYQQNQHNRYHPDPSALKVARLHYSGGGDWYWGSSAIPNFLKFVRDNTDFPIDTIERQVRITDPELFQYPFLFATGHGVISFSAEEQERLRQYLIAGGFLFVNDSYGMDETFRREMADLFPEREIVELPFEHKIYHSFQ